MNRILRVAVFCFFQLSVLLVISSSALARVGSAATERTDHRLIVMLPPQEASISSERLVSHFYAAPLSVFTQQIKRRFGNPVAVSYLLKDRINLEERVRLEKDDSLSRLQHYVVLDYLSRTDKELAAQLISLDRDVRAFDSQEILFSSVPNDPSYQQGVSGGVNITSQRTAYQTLMNVEPAWDAVQGNAYVAVVDSGVDSSHPDLIPNIRRHFSKNHAIESVTAIRKYGVKTNPAAVARVLANPNGNTPIGTFPSDFLDATYVVLPDAYIGPVSGRSSVCPYDPSNPMYVLCYGYNNPDPAMRFTRLLGEDEWGDLRNTQPYFNSTTHWPIRLSFNPFYGNVATSGYVLDVDEVTRGHGTHVAGIIAAKGGNGIGGSGVCQHCSVMSQRAIAPETWINAVIEAVNNGAQVINYSGGLPVPSGVDYCVNGSVNNPSCLAILYANSKNVQLVASSGNIPDVFSTQFPAMSSFVVSVGSVDSLGNPSSFSANTKVDFFAPGERIFSTFVEGGSWALDLAGPNTNCSAIPGSAYGLCTGTSMSSPMIAGAMALLRTADPLLSNSQTKSLLTSFVGSNGKPLLPNVAASMTKALSVTNGNRGMTPLFTMFSNTTQSYFSTSVPQMASAASCGTMRAGLSGTRAPVYFSAKGDSVAHLAAKYPQTFNTYPQTLNAPTLSQSCMPANTPFLASSMIFTTISRGGVGLIPIYRVSYVDTVNLAATINHIYTTSATEQGTFTTWGYTPDGAEGWVYPPNAPQPAGTIPLLRRWKYDNRVNEGVSRWVAAIFPANLAAAYAAEGYSTILYQGTLGYVCPVLGQTGVCAAPYTP
jgi:hypothetical protein